MSQANDVWYVRLPDGQVVRANSTEAVRHHLDSGRIPRESRVRRSPDEEWTTLEWMPEFADLLKTEPRKSREEPVRTERERSPREVEPEVDQEAPESEPALVTESRRGTARTDRMQLQVVGARGILEELLKAMDSTLIRVKLRVACLAGVLGALLVTLVRLFPLPLDWPWSLLPGLGVGLGLLVIGAFCTTLLTQLTFVELSRARSARWAEATAGLGRNTFRLLVAYLVVIGIPALAAWFLPMVPGWLPMEDWPEAASNATMGGVIVVWLIVLALLGPLLAFVQLLAPILVVEECSAGRALGQWRRFLREHLSRIYLYEALAAAVGAVAALPLLLPVILASTAATVRETTGILPHVIQITLGVLGGLALTPLIAYQAVANVFIYLNLRYEQGPRR